MAQLLDTDLLISINSVDTTITSGTISASIHLAWHMHAWEILERNIDIYNEKQVTSRSLLPIRITSHAS